MSSFAYDAPFTPSRPRKKRKNRAGKQPADHPAALERTRQELLTGDWSQASQGQSCARPLAIASAFPDLPTEGKQGRTHLKECEEDEQVCEVTYCVMTFYLRVSGFVCARADRIRH